MAPGPPPPPPPPQGPPPPPGPLPAFATASKGGGDDRNQLLCAIRHGTKLKKTVTIDKSAPFIAGKKSSNDNVKANNVVGKSGSVPNGSVSSAAPMGLGGLFAGGIPKLKPTGKFNVATTNGNKVGVSAEPNQALSSQPKQPHAVTVNASKLTAQLSDALSPRGEAPARPAQPPNRNPNLNKARGPPPQPPPTKSANSTASDTGLTVTSPSERLSSPGTSKNAPQTADSFFNNLQPNESALHGGSGGSVSLSFSGSTSSLNSRSPSIPSASSASTSDLSTDNQNYTKVTLNHGKPNLAPKPPITASGTDSKQSPPLKKLIVNGKLVTRAQSMRIPKSPGGAQRPAPTSQQPPSSKTNATHFGTLRPARVRPPAVSPPAPPTGGSLPPPLPPPNPPPPPPARAASLSAAPLPPPHQRSHHVVTNGSGDERPSPPVRGSSMRHRELDARFADLFHPPTNFPPPDSFRRLHKAGANTTTKQPAPPPPC